jgi:hypothetical protein
MGARDQQTLNHLMEFTMARKANTFSLTKIIATRRDNLAAARKEVTTLVDKSAQFRAAIHVVNMVADYANEIGFTKWSGISTFNAFEACELNVSLEGTVSSLKQGVIVDMIDRALACGFEAVGSKDYLSDWASQRTFKFTHSIAGVQIDMNITANISEASESCRKVQVGTELKEVAKYEIVCA